MKIMMQGLAMNKDGRLVKVAEEVEKDRRVLGAALTVICNCVNDFSPLRTVGSPRFFLQNDADGNYTGVPESWAIDASCTACGGG